MERHYSNPLDLAQQLQNDGALCLAQGDRQSAEHLYSHADQIILATVGRLHRLVAENLLNMGTVNRALGFNLKAREQFSAALTIANTTMSSPNASVA